MRSLKAETLSPLEAGAIHEKVTRVFVVETEIETGVIYEGTAADFIVNALDAVPNPWELIAQMTN